jgi:porphobilinogen synthase
MTDFSDLTIRLRRSRSSNWMRELLAENHILPSDLILPLFVIEGKNKQEKINNLPGVSRLSIDLIVKKAKEAQALGIPALMLFPVIDQKLKTIDGKEALNKNNLICRTVKEIKKAVPDIGVICDVALDPYTSHGHDGLIDKSGYVLNDETIEILCQQAIVQAKAGCDIIAPSDMMDGRVLKIRQALDSQGFIGVSIMSYAAKYASNFYGPFRDAVGSKGSLKGDKKTYQMDFRNSIEAMNEIDLDIAEGADMLIIKPGMPYLDVIKEASKNYQAPIIAYQVSGEYAMLKHAANVGAFDFDKAFYESLIAFKRAGARAIITYGALEFAKSF